MRKVIVCNIVSLDGFYEGPGANFMVLPMDEAFDAYNRERIEAAQTVLLGRTSYQVFSSHWPGVADAPPDPENRSLSGDNRALSRIYNGLEKVVVSDNYTPAGDNPWHDTTTVISGAEVAAWITHARRGEGGDVLVFGSRTLWTSLLADGLVDELHLVVGSVVLGAGTPLFSGPVDGLTLLDVRRFAGSDNVLHCYGAPKHGG